MRDYILLMHNDGGDTKSDDWNTYIDRMNQSGNFEGGSSIGGGVCISKTGVSNVITKYLSGYIRIKAMDVEHAQELLQGNPVFEAGGTVEIRELTRS